MRFSKTQLIIFLIACVSTVSVVYFANFLLSPSKNEFFQQFFTEGYNFHKLQSNDEDFAKYKVGDKIDLSKLSTTNEDLFLSTAQEDLLLLVVIDPVCGYCSLSKDIMSEVRKTTNQVKIGYYPVLFTSNPSKVNLKSYVNSLGFTDSLKWEDSLKPPQLLISMPTPAHILVDRNGTIFQVWFSSNNDEKIRKRMSDQISSDLFVIRDVFQALKESN